MSYFRTKRLQKLSCEIAGLEAKLEATNKIIDRISPGTNVNGWLLTDLQELPQQIAERQERKRQLEGSVK